MSSRMRQGKWFLVLAPVLIALGLSSVAPAGAQDAAHVSIVGGTETSITKWPWQVAFLTAQSKAPKKTPRQRLMCGGTLVAPTMIVTAAHCAVDIDSSKPEYFSVIAGRTRLNDTSTGVEVPVKDAFFPTTRSGIPRYMLLFEIRWDLALVELAEPVDMTPIKLVGPDESDLIAPGRRAVKTGWGMVDPKHSNKVSPVLMQGKTAIQKPKTCAYLQDYGFLPPFDRDSQVCLGDLAAKTSPCNGDSGGPAVVASSDGYRLFGATSYGLDDDCSPQLPSTDAALAQPDVRDWIAGIVEDKTGVDPVGSGATTGALPPTCQVPMVEATRLFRAKARIRSGGCKVGKIKYRRIPHRKKLKRYDGLVLMSNPSPFWLKNPGTKVNMLVAKWFPKPNKRHN